MEGTGGRADANGRRRVLVPQALGADQYLRATWHRQREIVVVSHWDGATCVAATPVRVGDVGELAELLVAALADCVDSADVFDAAAVERSRASDWGPPEPADRIDDQLPPAQSA